MVLSPHPTAQPPAQALGATVRAEMARRQKTQNELAAHLGLSQTAVSNRLAGRVAWNINEIAATAAFLGVSVEELVTDSMEHVA